MWKYDLLFSDIAGWAVFDWQEYIRRQLEEEQRHLEILQQQLLHEQAMLLVSVWLPCLTPQITFIYIKVRYLYITICFLFSEYWSVSSSLHLQHFLTVIFISFCPKWFIFFNVSTTPTLLNFIMQVLIIPPLHKLSWFGFLSDLNGARFLRLTSDFCWSQRSH